MIKNGKAFQQSILTFHNISKSICALHKAIPFSVLATSEQVHIHIRDTQTVVLYILANTAKSIEIISIETY